MAILGLGTDVVSIERIKLAKNKHAAFTERILRTSEIEYTAERYERLAGFFAAKEAAVKALGTGIGKISWKDIEISHGEAGAPYLTFYGSALLHAEKLGVRRIHVSISHERQYAVATVILED